MKILRLISAHHRDLLLSIELAHTFEPQKGDDKYSLNSHNLTRTGKDAEGLAPYKFFLAFENSECRDYVTEDFWGILNSTLAVPIVMGGADYEKIAPPNSYLDVRNFTSPRVRTSYYKIM